MKKTVKVVLGVLAGVVMAGTAGAAVWLAVGRGSAEEPATEVRSATLAELPDGTVDLALVREAYEQFEISSLREFYRDELLTEFFGDNGDGEQDESRELEDGADMSSRYIRRLERAEKAGNRVYLYERALSVNCRPDPRFDEEGNQIGGGSSCGILTVAATCGTPEFGWSGEMEGMTDEEILNEATERGLGLMRWEFELVEGRLVYRGMERADVGAEDSGDGGETEDSGVEVDLNK